ncbi:ankyrin repeat-containing domain protein [Choanephora cucurbitarum]|nr:ankyrin repeat-containing domain protein [Choanephora cucurbitarum]
MPTLFSKTFTLLNNIKPPTIESSNIDHYESLRSDKDDVAIELAESPKPSLSIWKAAEQNDLKSLTYYIEHAPLETSTLLNTRDPDTDCTLLHLLIANASDTSDIFPALTLLLKHGADATARNVYNVQAVHMISLHYNKPLPAMQQLLAHHANPNARDGDGWTPLHYAARFCSNPHAVLQLLIDHGAHINSTDAGNKTPLFGLLANNDLVQAFEYLIVHAKADLCIRGDFLDPISRNVRQGSVVLQAVKYRRLECLEFLIKSQMAFQQLKQVLDKEELDYANQMVKEQQLRLTTEQEVAKSELILQLLQELEDQLERDGSSFFAMRASQTTSIITNGHQTTQGTANKSQLQHKSSSFVGAMLDHMRNKTTVQRKSSMPNRILRKVSLMLQRSKSESSEISSLKRVEEELYNASNRLPNE